MTSSTRVSTAWWRGVSLVSLACVLALAGCGTTTRTVGQPTLPTAADNTGRGANATELDPARRAAARLDLAWAYFGNGQMAPALEEVKLSIAADPRVAAAYNLRGLIYASQGNEPLAEESFNRALQLDGRDADTLQNYGWYHCQKKHFDEADAMFVRALALPQYRDSSRTLLTRGICQARAGRWLEAEGSLTRSYELDPSNPATAVNLAEVLYKRNELERARFYIRRVNGQSEVVNAQTLWLAARIEQKLGNRLGAQDAGNQLRSRFPQSPEALAFGQGRFDD